jgi:pyridoxine kinase
MTHPSHRAGCYLNATRTVKRLGLITTMPMPGYGPDSKAYSTCCRAFAGVQYAPPDSVGLLTRRLTYSMTVISIQSQVAYGHVGNSAAVFPMQMHGIDVIAVPTTLLSNRPGYPTIRGKILDADLVADLLVGIEERGAVDTCQIILSGYLGSPQIAAVVTKFVVRAKRNNPGLIYCCDPVLGDSDSGVFVPAEIPRMFRDFLCPLANIITPNHFELEWLCGTKANTIGEVITNARSLSAKGPSTIIITSAQLADTPEDRIDIIAIEGSSVWRLSTPKLPIRPSGTGDLFSSLLVSSLIQGADTQGALVEAASATFAVLEYTAAAGTEEMKIVEAASLLCNPPRRFEAIPICT